MMTRREKLLIRPWQLRRYNNHKKKVINAVAIVDFGPPPQRGHVTVKLKKLQKERERQMKIEEDNFKLLQHLGSIMSTKRVDNYWETEPPTFLRRVGIYHRTRTPTPCEEIVPLPTPETLTTRKSKCIACTPYRETPVIVPEERIPWEPPKKILTRRQSGSAIVPIMSDFDYPPLKSIRHEIKLQERPPSPSKKTSKKKPAVKKRVPTSKSLALPLISSERNSAKMDEQNQKVVVRQGPLQIALSFPSFAEVKLIRGKSEKYLQKSDCDCKGFKENKTKLVIRDKTKVNAK